MAERMLAHAVRERVGDRAAEFVLSESAGTGGWHAGQSMNGPASVELRRRGVADADFRARKLMAAYIDSADLVLTATEEQSEYVAALRPDATNRVFVLGEFGRLARMVDLSELPPYDGTPEDVHARGVALVAAVNDARGGAAPEPGDDLEDPWGRSAAFFTRTADEIDTSVEPLVDALFPKVSHSESGQR
jgi:protein-tyrosine phosphatase